MEPLQAFVPTREAIERAFQAAARALIEAAEGSVPDDAKVRIDAVEEALASRRRAAFPVQGFEKQPLGEWVPLAETEWAKIDTYLKERARVDEQTRRLTSLFREALALPAVAKVRTPIDCPLCDTKEALTPERVDFIRQRVQETEHFQAAQAEAKRALRELDRTVRLLITSVDSWTPRFLRWSSDERRRSGFRVPRLRGIIGDDASSFVDPWIASARRFSRLRAGIEVRAGRMLHAITVYLEDPTSLVETTSLKQGLRDLSAARQAFMTASQQYLPLERTLTSRLHAIIDTESRTTGWQELIDLARDPVALRAALVEQAARQTVNNELTRALTQLDRAKEKVLDGKFQDLSDAIQRWWDLLRPEEPTYFSALKQRPGTRRTIDFKAGLSPHSDRSVTKVRDVIAVFSQSQLQCLGLALFIARAAHEGTGCVVLDDPVLSSDDDYRAHFNASVIEQLIDLSMQVIILTQDQKTWKDLEHRYLHRNIDMFQISLQNPLDGPIVRHTSDDLAAMLTRVRSLVGGDHPELRKLAGGYLRDAAERLCKEVLVRSRWKQGDRDAALSHYDGKNLSAFCPKVEPLLIGDASHPGKLRAARDLLNPAQHDDTIPSRGSLRVALGDLERLKADYL